MKRIQGWFWLTALVVTWWIPLPLLASVLITYSASHPRRWLLALAIASELLTALPLGIMTGVVFTPLLIRRWFFPKEALPTTSFLGVLLCITSVQYLLLGSIDMVGGVLREGASALARYMPYAPLSIGILTSTFTAFAFFSVRILLISPKTQ